MRENAKTMTLRLNAAEYAHLCQQAKAAGLKKEPFIRTLIMGVNLRPRPPDEYAEIRRQLAAIGNNINQIARTVNARGFASGEVIAAITAAQETIWNIAERLCHGIHQGIRHPRKAGRPCEVRHQWRQDGAG